VPVEQFPQLIDWPHAFWTEPQLTPNCAQVFSGVQLPAVQDVPAPHTTPHAPQLLESPLRVVHVPLQFVCPAPQDGAAEVHAPALHVWPPVQATPHAPQLVALVWRFTSQPSAALPLQLANPAVHEVTAHAPALQVTVSLLVRQTTPHAPQLLGSV
jgi:hypothetical protein